VSEWRLAPLFIYFAELDNTCAVTMYDKKRHTEIGYGLVDYIKMTLYLTKQRPVAVFFLCRKRPVIVFYIKGLGSDFKLIKPWAEFNNKFTHNTTLQAKHK
jgi:hypothetical protein